MLLLKKYDREIMERRMRRLKEADIVPVFGDDRTEKTEGTVYEDCDYMPDFIFDSDGRLTELRYHKVFRK